MGKEKFIADGCVFNSYEEVEKYAKDNGYRITGTEAVKTKKGMRHIVSLNK
jgi:hypothetical protein